MSFLDKHMTMVTYLVANNIGKTLKSSVSNINCILVTLITPLLKSLYKYARLFEETIQDWNSCRIVNESYNW